MYVFDYDVVVVMSLLFVGFICFCKFVANKNKNNINKIFRSSSFADTRSSVYTIFTIEKFVFNT